MLTQGEMAGNIKEWMQFWANQLQAGVLFLRPDNQSIEFINNAAFQLLDIDPQSHFQVELLLQETLEEVFFHFHQHPTAAEWLSKIKLTLSSRKIRAFSLHAFPTQLDTLKTITLLIQPALPFLEDHSAETETAILHELIEHTPNALVVIDPDGKVFFWNSAAEHLTGIPRSTILNQPAAVLPPPFNSAIDNANITGPPQGVTWFTWDLNNRTWHAGCLSSSQPTTNQELQQVNEQLWRLVTELEQRNREVNELNQLSDMLQSCLDMTDAAEVISRVIPRLMEGCSGALYIANESGSQVALAVNWGDLAVGADTLALEDCWGLRRMQIHSIPAGESRLHCVHIPEGETCAHFCAPLVVQGKIIGLLSISDPTSAARKPARQRLIETLAGQMALALSNLRLREGLHHQAIHDSLTGLYNRNYMEESFTRELRRAARHAYGLAVLMICIDQFGEMNNLLGRETGDVLLIELAQFLNANIRGSDIACRFSGTEFVLVLPLVHSEDAHKRATDLCLDFRRQVSFSQIPAFNDLTLSIGIAVYPNHGSGVDTLLSAADEAMRRAHNECGNKIYTAA